MEGNLETAEQSAEAKAASLKASEVGFMFLHILSGFNSQTSNLPHPILRSRFSATLAIISAKRDGVDGFGLIQPCFYLISVHYTMQPWLIALGQGKRSREQDQVP